MALSNDTYTYRCGEKVSLNKNPYQFVVMTYDAKNTAALNNLYGKNRKGDWKLSVKDRALFDKGQLNEWSLEIQAGTDKEVMVEESPGITIPDDQTAGISRTLKVEESGHIKDLQVTLDLTHTYIGDLTIELITPRNGSILLHNRLGGNTDNIIKTYSLLNSTVLEPLLGHSIAGDWRLNIIDHARADVGKLNHWQLRFWV